MATWYGYDDSTWFNTTSNSTAASTDNSILYSGTSTWADSPSTYVNIETLSSCDSTWVQVLQPGKSAHEKGQQLLKEVLGDVLLHQYRKNGYVDIPSIKHIDLAYRIRPGQMIGILRKRNGQWVEQAEALCVHAIRRHVQGDEMAIHVILCRDDEDTLWAMANHHNQRAA